MNQPLIMAAGQSRLSRNVLDAMSNQVISSIQIEFDHLMERISDNCTKLFLGSKDYYSFPIYGTGTAAMEAVLLNLLDSSSKALILSNGFFGERALQIAIKTGADISAISIPVGEPFDLKLIEQKISEFLPDIVYVVHGETSSGIVNPIYEIAKIAKRYNALIAVDASTTFGGCELRIKDWAIDVAFSVSQKCVGMCAGLAPVILNESALERMKFVTRKNLFTSFYFDIPRILESWFPNTSYHVTPPINLLFGLDAALTNIAARGINNQWELHRKNANILYSFFQKKNYELFVGKEHMLHTLLAIKIPKFNAKLLRDKLLEKGILVSCGLDKHQDDMLRIGLLTTDTLDNDVTNFKAAFEDVVALL